MSGRVGVSHAGPLGRLVACSLLLQGSRLPITRMHGLAAFQLSRVWFLPATRVARSVCRACALHTSPHFRPPCKCWAARLAARQRCHTLQRISTPSAILGDPCSPTLL